MEGERKAIFEDCEAEKSDNKERIKKLKDEVKDLQNELLTSDKSSEGILKQVQDKKTLDTRVLKRKSGDEAVLTLDYKVPNFYSGPAAVALLLVTVLITRINSNKSN